MNLDNFENENGNVDLAFADGLGGGPIRDLKFNKAQLAQTIGVSSFKNFGKHLLEAMPATSQLQFGLAEATGEASSAFDDFLPEWKRATKSAKAIANYQVVKNRMYMPKKLYKRLYNATVSNDSEIRQEAIDAQEVKLAHMMEGVFGSTEGLREDSGKMLSASIAGTTAMVEGLTSIRKHLLFRNKFLTSTQQNWMKKSLELQARHLSIAGQHLAISKRTLSLSASSLQAIIKNTALPNELKYSLKLRGKEAISSRMYSTGVSGLSNIAANMTKSFRAVMIDTLGMMADQMESSLEMDSVMGEFDQDNRVQSDITSLGGKLGGKLMSKFIIPRLGSKPAIANARIKGMMNMFNYGGEGGRQYLKNSKYGKFLLPFMNPEQTDINTGNSVLNKPTAAAKFDVLTRQSIVEIIPAWLARIAKNTKDIFTGRETTLERYDVTTRKIVDINTASRNFGKYIYGDSQNRPGGFGEAVGAAYYSAGRSGNVGDIPKLKDILKIVVANAIVSRVGLQPSFFEPYLGVGSNELLFDVAKDNKDKLIIKLLDGISNKSQACDLMYHTMTKGYGKNDIAAISSINRGIYKELAWQQLGNNNVHQKLSEMVDSFGASDLLDGQIGADGSVSRSGMRAGIMNTADKYTRGFYEGMGKAARTSKIFGGGGGVDSKDDINLYRIQSLVKRKSRISPVQYTRLLIRAGIDAPTAIRSSFNLADPIATTTAKYGATGPQFEMAGDPNIDKLYGYVASTAPKGERPVRGIKHGSNNMFNLGMLTVLATSYTGRSTKNMQSMLRAVFVAFPSWKRIQIQALKKLHSVVTVIPRVIDKIMKSTVMGYFSVLGEKLKSAFNVIEQIKAVRAKLIARRTKAELNTYRNSMFVKLNGMATNLAAISASTEGLLNIQEASSQAIKKKSKREAVANRKGGYLDQIKQDEVLAKGGIKKWTSGMGKLLAASVGTRVAVAGMLGIPAYMLFKGGVSFVNKLKGEDNNGVMRTLMQVMRGIAGKLGLVDYRKDNADGSTSYTTSAGVSNNTVEASNNAINKFNLVGAQKEAYLKAVRNMDHKTASVIMDKAKAAFYKKHPNNMPNNKTLWLNPVRSTILAKEAKRASASIEQKNRLEDLWTSGETEQYYAELELMQHSNTKDLANNPNLKPRASASARNKSLKNRIERLTRSWGWGMRFNNSQASTYMTFVNSNDSLGAARYLQQVREEIVGADYTAEKWFKATIANNWFQNLWKSGAKGFAEIGATEDETAMVVHLRRGGYMVEASWLCEDILEANFTKNKALDKRSARMGIDPADTARHLAITGNVLKHSTIGGVIANSKIARGLKAVGSVVSTGASTVKQGLSAARTYLFGVKDVKRNMFQKIRDAHRLRAGKPAIVRVAKAKWWVRLGKQVGKIPALLKRAWLAIDGYVVQAASKGGLFPKLMKWIVKATGFVGRKAVTYGGAPLFLILGALRGLFMSEAACFNYADGLFPDAATRDSMGVWSWVFKAIDWILRVIDPYEVGKMAAIAIKMMIYAARATKDAKSAQEDVKVAQARLVKAALGRLEAGKNGVEIDSETYAKIEQMFDKMSEAEASAIPGDFDKDAAAATAETMKKHAADEEASNTYGRGTAKAAAEAISAGVQPVINAVVPGREEKRAETQNKRLATAAAEREAAIKINIDKRKNTRKEAEAPSPVGDMLANIVGYQTKQLLGLGENVMSMARDAKTNAELLKIVVATVSELVGTPLEAYTVVNKVMPDVVSVARVAPAL